MNDKEIGEIRRHLRRDRSNITLAWIVIGITVVTTVYSGVEYFVQNWKCLWE